MANSELHMIGPVNRDMHSFLNLYSGPKIKLLGVKNQSELYKYYSQGSVFVMMSIEEGLAMVQLQAMSCGLPLICSENTGVSDLISDGIEGFIIPIRDVNLLKARLDFLYNNENIREEMGKKALLKAKVGFKWEDYGNRMVNFYTKILNT
jgi:glycosyltransferase involved in cell wall biosynthesis